MLNVMVVYGTRPEAIKLAPLVVALQQRSDVRCTVVVTGQHTEMVDQVHRDYGITVDHALSVFQQGQGLDRLTARVLEGLGPLLERERPDVVVVQGDTTSCLAAALAAFHAEIPLVHLEAGMRSGNLAAPFPEEMYRRVIAQLASLHLAASDASRQHLLREGVQDDAIAVVGSTAVDALFHVLESPADLGPLKARIAAYGRLVVVTCHRRESWGEPMARVASAVARLAQSWPETLFVLSAHPNPVVREVLLPPLAGLDNVEVTEPLGYREFASLMQNAHLLLTDSGGVQAEAPTMSVPVLVLRDTTEYTETLDAGSAILVGTDADRILDEATRILDDPDAHATMRIGYSPYGDGRAGVRSAEAVVSFMQTGHHLVEDLRPAPGMGLVSLAAGSDA